MEYVINFTWDPEACVWIATSDDVPGLVLESGSFDALVERVHFAIPELLALNGESNASNTPLNLIYRSERRDQVAVYG
ncbi:MAG: DUF1902 domain-containing protein [Lachnospiraceae bacterium]|nr:DUF1902 domain-containing protein [Lachnospiraceae bacterium]